MRQARGRIWGMMNVLSYPHKKYIARGSCISLFLLVVGIEAGPSSMSLVYSVYLSTGLSLKGAVY